jgi:DNA-binding response OmpR family regulator
MPAGCVLVVEDDQDIREGLLDTLTDHGYQSRGAANGRDALDAMRTQHYTPCMILLDIMMPVMDGVAFREEQLRDPELAGIPVVLISAHRDLAEKAKTLKAAAYLVKPLKLKDLLALTDEYC